MDVHGRTNDAYFRRNVWGWHDLADAVRSLQPGITAGCIEWHTNSGDGLDEEAAHQLAAALREDLASGDFTAWLAENLAEKARAPRTVCRLCGGTGLRTDAIGRQYGYDQFTVTIDGEGYPKFTGGCNGCAGRGTEDPWAWSYAVAADDIREFADFLEACDGFTID